jgi:enoyl-CoA hydratase
MAYTTLLIEMHGPVALIRLNRPEALNAINAELVDELNAALAAIDADDAIGAVVLTGSEKAFAAGADIKQMRYKTYAEAQKSDFMRPWQQLAQTRKPVIAAVAGFALGGGCEIAMMCSFIIAADNAKFGQPEIRLGILPGGGGTQRLTRAIGKAKAMEMILTGRMMNAEEAERAGLVARVVPAQNLMEEAIKTATVIAGHGRLAIELAMQMVNRADEVALAEGIHAERQAFYSLFATEDQKEGMSAFIEKRTADFKNR